MINEDYGGGVADLKSRVNALEKSNISNTNKINNLEDNFLYTLLKSTGSGTSISITVPGHANRAYDRIACWIFGNANGSPDYGILITASDEKGGSANAQVKGNFSPSCTYTNSGNDRIITLSGLSPWSNYCIISPWKIL